MTNQEKLYQTAKQSLGKRMIITPGVPNLLGCASSLSGVLKAAGYTKLPKAGIAGTSALDAFLREIPDFEKTTDYERGLVIMFASGQPGAVLEHGHVFVAGDHGLMSNDSDTGLWMEKWGLEEAQSYYHGYGKLAETRYRWLG
jgi:hypothetical protein